MMMKRKISVRFIKRMFSVILFGVFCCFVFLISVIIWLRKFFFGLVVMWIIS